MHSHRRLWDELVEKYTQGVRVVESMAETWSALSDYVDPERFAQVRTFLVIQEKEARWWRDASIAYFPSLSHLPLPEGYEPPAHDLAYYDRTGS